MNRITYIDDIQTWKEEFTFSHEVQVRFRETDMFGHMNNTVTFAYFELARIEYFKAIGFMQDWVEPGNETIPVVADLQCDYIKQVFFDQKLNIHVKPAKLGNSSVDLHYMAVDEEGEICFTGRGTIVQYSKRTAKGAPWSSGQKDLFYKEPALSKRRDRHEHHAR